MAFLETCILCTLEASWASLLYLGTPPTCENLYKFQNHSHSKQHVGGFFWGGVVSGQFLALHLNRDGMSL